MTCPDDKASAFTTRYKLNGTTCVKTLRKPLYAGCATPKPPHGTQCDQPDIVDDSEVYICAAADGGFDAHMRFCDVPLDRRSLIARYEHESIFGVHRNEHFPTPIRETTFDFILRTSERQGYDEVNSCFRMVRDTPYQIRNVDHDVVTMKEALHVCRRLESGLYFVDPNDPSILQMTGLDSIWGRKFISEAGEVYEGCLAYGVSQSPSFVCQWRADQFWFLHDSHCEVPETGELYLVMSCANYVQTFAPHDKDNLFSAASDIVKCASHLATIQLEYLGLYSSIAEDL